MEAVQRVPELSRKRCREVFEQRFTVTRMARDYLQAYKRLTEGKQNETLEAHE